MCVETLRLIQEFWLEHTYSVIEAVVFFSYVLIYSVMVVNSIIAGRAPLGPNSRPPARLQSDTAHCQSQNFHPTIKFWFMGMNHERRRWHQLNWQAVLEAP